MPYGTKRKSSFAAPPAKRQRTIPKALSRKTRKPRYRATLKLTKPFKAVLGKYLDRNNETHWNTQEVRQQLLPPQPQSGVGGIYRIIPSVVQAGVPTLGDPQGISDDISTREGSRIRLKSMSLDLMLRLNPSFSANNATGVWYRLLVCTCKAYPQYTEFIDEYYGAPPIPGLKDSVFKEGATPVAYTPSMVDISNPINHRLFTVHAERQGILSKGQQVAPGTGNTYALHAFRRIKMNLKVKSKILNYNNPDDTYPTSFQPFLICFWKDLDSYDYTLTSPVPNYVEVSGKCHMSWDDMS